MTGVSKQKGQELLYAVLDELKKLDPKIVPFDSDEIKSLEESVVQGVRDVFGSESPEYSEFEGFRVAAGNISRGDSRADKQTKYEFGLPKAVTRLEELLNLIDQSEEHLKKSQGGSTSGGKPAGKATPPKPVPAEKTQAKPSGTPTEGLSSKPAAKKEPMAAPKAGDPATAEPKKNRSASGQPGRILLLQEGGDGISSVVRTLLEKVGIDLAFLDKEHSFEFEGIMGLKNIVFTIVAMSPENRGGLSGLTSVIGKPHTKLEGVFKLGLLVGRLGPGKIVILHSGERPQDIPEDLFGVRYIPFKEEGGWQIGLLKLLKANGFFIDANLLFD